MAISISYISERDTIVATGGTVEDPISYDDILAADQQNGWGVITSPAQDEFVLSARLEIGDGVEPTYFATSNNKVRFEYSFLEIKNNATFISHQE